MVALLLFQLLCSLPISCHFVQDGEPGACTNNGQLYVFYTLFAVNIFTDIIRTSNPTTITIRARLTESSIHNTLSNDKDNHQQRTAHCTLHPLRFRWCRSSVLLHQIRSSIQRSRI